MLKNIERTQLKTNARHPLNTPDEKEDQMFAYRDGNENRYQHAIDLETERLGISTKGNIMFMFMFMVAKEVVVCRRSASLALTHAFLALAFSSPAPGQGHWAAITIRTRIVLVSFQNGWL